MVRIVDESVQLIHIDKDTVLSPSLVGDTIQRAYSNRMYAKFYTDKYFIQVNFSRDGNISVSTNIRSPQFIQDLWVNDRSGWSINKIKAFVYRWMQVQRRSLS